MGTRSLIGSPPSGRPTDGRLKSLPCPISYADNGSRTSSDHLPIATAIANGRAVALCQKRTFCAAEKVRTPTRLLRTRHSVTFAVIDRPAGERQCPGGRNSIVVLFLIAWSISSAVIST